MLSFVEMIGELDARASDESPYLSSLIRDARRRLRRAALFQGSVAALSVLVIAVAAGALATALKADDGTIAMLQLAIAVGGLGLLFARYFLLFRFFRPPEVIAHWLDSALRRHRSTFGTPLLSAFELARDRGRFPESEALTEKAIRDAAIFVRHAVRGEEVSISKRGEARRLVRLETWPTLRLRLVLLAMLVTGLGLGVYLVPHVFRESLAALMFPRNIETAILRLPPDPRLSDFTLTYRYPAYASRQDKTDFDSTGDILALPGTEITMWVRARHELSSAVVLMSHGNDSEEEPSRVAAQVDGHRIRASFIVSRQGRYRLRVIGADGRLFEERRGHGIDLELDQPPDITILEPTETPIEVNERDRMRLAFDAKDDFGLGELFVSWRILGTAKAGRVPVPASVRGTRRHVGSTELNLADLALKPGDRVAYTIEVTDNDTVTGPKTGSSATQELRVYSKKEHHRGVLALQERALDELVHILGDSLELPVSTDADIARLRTLFLAARKIVDRGATADALLRSVIAAIKKDPIGQVEVASAFEQARLRLQKDVTKKEAALTSAERLLDRTKRADATSIRQVAKTQSSLVAGLEKHAVYLADVLNEQRMMDAESLMKDLRSEQKALRDAIEAYRKAPDADRRRAIAETIRSIRQRIQEIAAELSKIRGSIPQDLVNPDALEAKDAAKTMDRIEQLMEEGKLDEAMAEIDRMLSESEDALAKLQSGRTELERREYSEIAERAQRIWDGLQEVGEKERRLIKSTERVSKAVLDRIRSRLGDGNAFVEKQVRRLRIAGENIEAARPPPIFAAESEEFDRIERRIEDARMAFEARDFGAAREMVEMARETVGRMQQDARRRGEYARRFGDFLGAADSARKSEADLRRASPILDEILDDLNKLMPPPESVLSEEEQRSLNRDQEEQNAIKLQLDKLDRSLDELGKDLPIVGPEVRKMMEEAQAEMQGASDGLRAGDAPSALGHEQRALQALDQLGQELAKAAKKGGGQGKEGGVPLPFGQADEQSGREGEGLDLSVYEKVQIPQPDQYKAPAEFREDILEAAKQGTVEDFKDSVREYYEELVK